MKAQITFRELWSNPSVRRFFFRPQSEETLHELWRLADDWEDALDKIEEYSDDLDEVEELFYEETPEWLADEFRIEIYKDEDEDE